VIPIGLQTAPQTDPLLEKLDTAIGVSSRRFLAANVHSPWQIFHGLLALKQSFQLNLGGQKVNAIEWIATAEPQFDNQPLLMKTPHGGKFHAFTRPYAFEGHPAQFLALLSQSDLPTNYQFKVGTGSITIGDIINNTMKEVNTREECTWVLWALQHYLPPTAQWVNQFNEPWSIERLVQIETAAPVVHAPCGGNHRLFALTRTRDKHLKSGGKLVGLWAQADYKIRQHIEIARSLQNSDGTFSSKFYETAQLTNDLNERFNTTGHTMEFLSIALPDNRLNEPWVRNAITILCNDLVANRHREITCGPLYHTLNSLIIYRERYRALLPSKPLDPVTAPALAPAIAPVPAPLTKLPDNGVPLLSKSPSRLRIPSAVAMPPDPAVATTPPTEAGRLDAKPVSRDAKTALAPPNKPAEIIVKPSTPATTAKPSDDALNELKLDKETRELLESLLVRGKLPAEISNDSKARPLESTGQPLLQIADEPASALKPANQ
jgi:hypothetical protein